jgi:hypothetical protein
MPRPIGEAPPTPEWTEFDYLQANDFDEVVERRIALGISRHHIEAEISKLDLELGVMLATADTKSVRYGEHRISLAHSTVGGKLSRERLVELGVSKDIIEAATSEKKPGNNYIRVTDVKGGVD